MLKYDISFNLNKISERNKKTVNKFPSDLSYEETLERLNKAKEGGSFEAAVTDITKSTWRKIHGIELE